MTRIQKPTGRKKKEEVIKFRIGDGVLVSVEGGDGVAVLTRLWEEPIPKDEDEDEDEEDEEAEPGGRTKSDRSASDEPGTRMMGEIHWCFRRKDLPGIMKDLKVEEVSISASLFIRPIERLGVKAKSDD